MAFALIYRLCFSIPHLRSPTPTKLVFVFSFPVNNLSLLAFNHLIKLPLQVEFSIGDLGAALRRRGPDSLGSKKLLLHSSDSDCEVVSSIGGLEEESNCECKSNCFSAANGRTPHLQCTCTIPSSSGELHFLGATLQLRGVNPLVQPLIDSSKNILVYNGMSLFSNWD